MYLDFVRRTQRRGLCRHPRSREISMYCNGNILFHITRVFTHNGGCFLFVIVYIHLVYEILIHSIIFSISCALNSFEKVYFIWT